MNRMSAALSIIVPIYNAGKYLDMLLQSIEKQTFQNFECIMVDDGSTDNSRKICKKIAERDKRFILISQENAGVSAARNSGLEVAQGSYIAFADADDVLELDMYASLMSAMNETEADIASCLFVYEKKFQALGIKATKDIFTIYPTPINLFYDKKLAVDILINKIYRRSLIGDICFAEDIKYTEDQLFVAEVLLKAKSMVLIDSVKYHYIEHEHSLSKQNGTYEFWLGHVKARYKVYELIQKSIATEKTKNSSFEKYGRAIFSLVRLSIQEKDAKLYHNLHKEFDDDVQSFFALPGKNFLNQFTYRTYWHSYFCACLIHGHKK